MFQTVGQCYTRLDLYTSATPVPTSDIRHCITTNPQLFGQLTHLCLKDLTDIESFNLICQHLLSIQELDLEFMEGDEFVTKILFYIYNFNYHGFN